MYRYVLKVSYKYKRKINLTLDISDISTLSQLAEMILTGFDFDQDHLYLFNMDGKKQGADSYYRIPEGRQRSTKIKLKKLYLHVKKKFLFLYDFGAEWEFEVAVQKAYESDARLANRILSVNGSLQQYPNRKDDKYLVFVKEISAGLKVEEILQKQSEEYLRGCARFLLKDYETEAVFAEREKLISLLAEVINSQKERILLCFNSNLLNVLFHMMNLKEEMTIAELPDIQTLSTLGFCLVEEVNNYFDEIDTKILIPKEVIENYSLWNKDAEIEKKEARYKKAEQVLKCLISRYGIIEIPKLYERFRSSLGEDMPYDLFFSFLKGRFVFFNRYSLYEKQDGTLFLTAYAKEETEEILREREKRKEIDYPVYSYRECQKMIREDIYYDNEPFRKILHNLLKKIGYSDGQKICDILTKYGTLGKEFDLAKEKIANILKENDFSFTKIREQLVQMAMEEMPKAVLKGWTKREYDAQQIEKIKEEQGVKNNRSKKARTEDEQMEGQISLFK